MYAIEEIAYIISIRLHHKTKKRTIKLCNR